MANKQSSKIKTGGGVFDPLEENVYFIASNVERMHYGQECHSHVLVAVNELNTETDFERLDIWLDAGRKVFIDSGIFWLTNQHARKNDVSMDEALALAPEDIDGFDDLFAKYTGIIDRYGSRCWGYIELDQGGIHNKKRTRQKLHDLGYNPIPVYHPLNDGYEYFDELCSTYDRICFGNVVQADVATRKRLIHTAWERRRKYPDVWIHLLGFTPNELLNAVPISSGDSSSWLSAVRWSGYNARACGKTMGPLPLDFRYKLGSDAGAEHGSRKATKQAAYGSYMMQMNWRNHLSALKEVGFDVYSITE